MKGTSDENGETSILCRVMVVVLGNDFDPIYNVVNRVRSNE